MEFVSVPVVAGFTSAAALIIASAQVKNLLGLKFNAEGFLDIWTNIISKMGQIKKWDALLSLCCCILLLALRASIYFLFKKLYTRTLQTMFHIR